MVLWKMILDGGWFLNLISAIWFDNYGDSDDEASEWNLKANVPNCHIISIRLLVSRVRTRSPRSRPRPLLLPDQKQNQNCQENGFWNIWWASALPTFHWWAILIKYFTTNGVIWVSDSLSWWGNAYFVNWEGDKLGFLSRSHLDSLLAKGKELGPWLWVGALALQQECGCEG